MGIKQFKPKEIDFSYQKVISFSQYQMYKQCAHKWYMKYVEKKLDIPPSVDLIFGTAIHHAIQQYLTIGYNDSFTKADTLDLDEIFHQKFVDEYSQVYKDNNNVHFSNPTELREYGDDGYEILKWFKSKRNTFFSKKGYKLLGIEMPVQKEVHKNLFFIGYLDVVLENTTTGEVEIYDLKTSKNGWGSWAKKDKIKSSQLIIYKQYFSELYGVALDKIKVEFIILKRKNEPSEWVQYPKRITTFAPVAGKIIQKQTTESLADFIKSAFDSEGKYIIKEHTKNVSKLCEYCPIYKTDLCKIEEKPSE